MNHDDEYDDHRQTQVRYNILRRRLSAYYGMDPRDPDRPDPEDIEALEATLTEDCF